MYGKRVQPEELPLQDGYSKHSRASAVRERAQQMQNMMREIGEGGAKYGVTNLRLDLGAVKETSLGEWRTRFLSRIRSTRPQPRAWNSCVPRTIEFEQNPLSS